jgi:phosphoglycerate dehydrogenase-like enzyme
MRPKIISLFPLQRFVEAGVSLPDQIEFHFGNATEEGPIISACQGMDFLLVPPAYPLISARVLDHIPSVRMIQTLGSGYDKVDVESAARMGIPVANSPGHNATTVAEFAIALIIALQRRIFLADREVKAGRYSEIREHFFKSGLMEVSETRLGLLGFGTIGRKVAELARILGARVSYYDIQRAPRYLEAEQGVTFKPLDLLLSQSDVLSLHLPLTNQNRELLGRRELKLMPRGALLINTARGELVSQEALAEVLEEGHLAGAAVDTVSPEPPPQDHPLLSLSPAAKDRLLMTPHIGGITRGALRRVFNASFENVLRVAAGDPPRNVVNGVPDVRTP